MAGFTVSSLCTLSWLQAAVMSNNCRSYLMMVATAVGSTGNTSNLFLNYANYFTK